MMGSNQLHFGASAHYRQLNDAGSTVRYRQRPAIHTTDVRFVDTGNINVFIALATWAGFWAVPVVGGFLWALGTGMKFVPVVLLPFIKREAWLPGIAVLVVLAILTLATWPDTVRQLEIVLNYPRPIRIDYMLLAWGIVPWLWAWLETREKKRRRAGEPAAAALAE